MDRCIARVAIASSIVIPLSALCGYLVWAVIALQDPEESRARVPADMSSSLSPPSELQISHQAELDDLLSGTGQDAREARHNVRSLDIRKVECVGEEWPRLRCLQHLSISVDKRNLAEFPRVLRASALPALRSLKLDCEKNYGDRKWACPLLEGRFEQLNHIHIEQFRMERKALDAVLHQVPNLAHLDLGSNYIGNEGCGQLAEALRERACPNLTHLHLDRNNIGNEGCGQLALGLKEGCPHLQTLDLQNNSIRALPDALGQLRSLTRLYISWNRIRRIQPALYGLILQLDEFHAFNCPLEDPPKEVYRRGLDALKRYLREVRRRGGVQELRTARVMLLGDMMHGKTTLCRSLPRGVPCPKVESRERTHALEIHDWVIDRPGAQELNIKLWDFAGHQVYYATHRSFFSRLCIYVVVARIEVDQGKMQSVIKSSIEWLMSICKAVPGGAQVVVVGTFPHDQREKGNEQALRDNLDLLKDRLGEADEERVRVWNSNRGNGNQRKEEAKAVEICGVMWVDCHSDDDHNVGPIAAKLEELAEKTVRDKQQFPGSYIETLEAHESLCASTRVGVSSLQAFRDRVGEAAEDGVMRDALQFANDVGILQYYPGIDRDIVFTDPLFLVQAFGVVIYDKEAFNHYITGRDVCVCGFCSVGREEKNNKGSSGCFGGRVPESAMTHAFNLFLSPQLPAASCLSSTAI